MVPKVFAFGNSHLSCMEAAYASQGSPEGVPFHFLNLNAHKDALASAAERNQGLSKYVVEYVQRTLSESDPDEMLWVSRLGGNEHNVLGLMEHPRSFDIVLPDHADLLLVEGAELVPYDFVRKTLGKRVRGSLFHIGRIVAETGVPVVHISSPPPVGDDAFVTAHLDSYFSDQSKRIAARSLRWKLWKMQTDLAREICAEMGAEFWPVPSGALDGEGFVQERFYSHDATHTNLHYGQLLNKAVANRAISRVGIGANL